MIIKKLALSVIVASSFASAWAHAEDAKPDNQVSYNLGLTSDYRYRGISQSRLGPAVQGGVDYTNNPSGFYAGAWASSIKWIKDAGGNGDVELDLYAGIRGNMSENTTFDVGVLRYEYKGNKLDEVMGANGPLFADASTTEVYAQFGVGPAYVKYSWSVSNLFGSLNSNPSGYLDVGANVALTDKLTLNLHGGHQEVKNWIAGSYEDVKVGLSYDFGVVVGSVALIATDANEGAYVSPKGQNLGKASVVVGVTKTF